MDCLHGHLVPTKQACLTPHSSLPHRWPGVGSPGGGMGWRKAKPVRLECLTPSQGKPLRPTCPGPGQMTAERWANASAGGFL